MINIPQNCPECGQMYRKADATLVSENKNNFLFHLTCDKCQVSTLMHVQIGARGILSVVKITDAGKKDIDKLRGNKSVSTDDVIEAYLALKELN